MTDTPKTTDITEIITPAISDRICKHMNKDHRDALLLYAQYFGSLSHAKAATLVNIDPTGMNLAVTSSMTSNESEQDAEQDIQLIHIPFVRPIVDARDVHIVLVEMVKEAEEHR